MLTPNVPRLDDRTPDWVHRDCDRCISYRQARGPFRDLSTLGSQGEAKRSRWFTPAYSLRPDLADFLGRVARIRRFLCGVD